MNVIIEIVSTQVRTRSGVSKRTGQQYSISEQAAYLHSGQPYPTQISLTLENGQAPYNVGNYDLHPSSYYADRYGNIAIRPILFPRPAETPQSMPNPTLPEGVQLTGKK